MKPMTVEELRALEVDDWVWIVDFEADDGVYYKIKDVFRNDRDIFTISDTFVYRYSSYGTKWLAYKNKEQAEAKENSRIISDKEFWELSNRYTQKELDERIEFAKKKVVEELKAKGEIVELPCLRDKPPVGCKDSPIKVKELNYMTGDGTICSRLYFEDEFEEAERRLAELKGEQIK